VLAPGIGEITGGSQREERLDGSLHVRWGVLERL
jgi:aspartyl/asparaginyl-tRNA synthetase